MSLDVGVFSRARAIEQHFTAYPLLTELRAYRPEDEDAAARGLHALLDSPFGERVEKVQLEWREAATAAARAIAQATHAVRLPGVSLRRTSVSAAALRSLLTSPVPLAHLGLWGERLEPDAVAELAAHGGRLRELWLYDGAGGPQELTAWTQARSLQGLRDLALCGNALGDGGAQPRACAAFARSTWA